MKKEYKLILFAVVVCIIVTFLIVLGMSAYSNMSFEAQMYRESQYLPMPELLASSYDACVYGCSYIADSCGSYLQKSVFDNINHCIGECKLYVGGAE